MGICESKNNNPKHINEYDNKQEIIFSDDKTKYVIEQIKHSNNIKIEKKCKIYPKHLDTYQTEKIAFVKYFSKRI